MLTINAKSSGDEYGDEWDNILQSFLRLFLTVCTARCQLQQSATEFYVQTFDVFLSKTYQARPQSSYYLYTLARIHIIVCFLSITLSYPWLQIGKELKIIIRKDNKGGRERSFCFVSSVMMYDGRAADRRISDKNDE